MPSYGTHSVTHDSSSWAASRRAGAGCIVSAEERLAQIEAELCLPSVAVGAGVTTAKLVQAHHRAGQRHGGAGLVAATRSACRDTEYHTESLQLLSLAPDTCITSELSSHAGDNASACCSVGLPGSELSPALQPATATPSHDAPVTLAGTSCPTNLQNTPRLGRARMLHAMPSRLPGVTTGMGETLGMPSYIKMKPAVGSLRKNVARHAFRNLAAAPMNQGAYALVGRNTEGASVRLRDCTLTDADVHAVVCALHAKQSITSIDLSDNPISDVGAALLMDAMRSVRTVVSVNVGGTLMSEGVVAEMQGLADATLQYQQRREEAARERQLGRGRHQQAASLAKALRRLQQEQAAEMARLRAEEKQQYRRLLFTCAASQKRAMRKQRRRELLLQHRHELQAVCKEEAAERTRLLRGYVADVRRLFAAHETGLRATIVSALLTAFKDTKKLEKADWTLTRREEKKRLARFGRILQAQEDIEQQHRGRIAEEEWRERCSFAAMAGSEVTRAFEVYEKRRELEEEASRRKETEVRRLEYEMISRREKEIIEERRLEERRRAEQQDILGSEAQRRAEHDADEAAARSTYLEIASNDHTVVIAREGLSRAEQAYLAQWRRPPTLKLVGHRAATKLIFECPEQSPCALNLDAELEHFLVDESADPLLRSLRNDVDEARDNLRERLSVASATVRHNGVHWNESLTYGARPQGRPTPPPYSELTYNAISDPCVQEPVWLRDAAQRLTIRGGEVSVDVPHTKDRKRMSSEGTGLKPPHEPSVVAMSLGASKYSAAKIHGADEFYPPFGSVAVYPNSTSKRDTGPESAESDLSKMVVTLPEDITLQGVAMLLNSIQYKFRGENNFAFIRGVRLRVGLLYPALSNDAPSRTEPMLSVFSNTERVEADVLLLTVVSPVLVPAPLTRVAWEEKKEEEERVPQDKGLAFLMESNMAPPASIVRASDASLIEGTVKGYRLAISVENSSLEDQLVVRTGSYADDADSYNRHDMELVPCPDVDDLFFLACDGCPIGTTTPITAVHEAVQRGECSPGTAETGVTITFNENATFAHFQRVLRRLRFMIVTRNVAATQDVRNVVVEVSDATDNEFTTRFPLEVIPSEKPSTMDLKATRVYYRSLVHPSLAQSLRKHCTPCYVFLFPQADVFDVDSDYVCGGGLEVSITNGVCAGDYIFTSPDNSNNISVEGSLVFYKMQCFGQLEKGLTRQLDFDCTKDDVTGYRSTRYTRRSISTNGSPCVSPRGNHSGGATPRRQTDMGLNIQLEPPVGSGELLLPSPLLAPNANGGASTPGAKGGRRASDWSGEESPPVSPTTSRTSSVASRRCRDSSISSLISPRGRVDTKNVEIRLKLVGNGSASLTAVSAFLRSLMYANSFFGPQDGSRVVKVELHVGPTAKERDFTGVDLKAEAKLLYSQPFIPTNTEIQSLSSRLEVKVTQPLFDLHPSHSVLEYREGSGYVKLAPFEIPAEVDLPKDCFDGNCFIRVEILEGGCDDDLLSVKPGFKEEFKVKDKKGVAVELPELGHPVHDSHGLRPVQIEKTVAQMLANSSARSPKRSGSTANFPGLERKFSHRNPPGLPERKGSSRNINNSVAPKGLPALDSSLALVAGDRGSHFEASSATSVGSGEMSPRTMSISLAGSVAPAPISRLKKTTNAIKDARSGEGGSEKGGNASELWSAGKLLGTVVSGKRQLLLRLGSTVTRKDVVGLLRCIVYKNKSQAPAELRKTVRVTLKDSSTTSSQTIVKIHVSEVDDVTQIVLHHNKLKYRPGQVMVQKLEAFPITEYGKDHFQDPDTYYFDGGTFTVEFVAGGVRGDVLSFLTAEQQEIMRENCQISPEVSVYSGPCLEYDGNTISLPDGVVVGTTEFYKSAFPGVANMRVLFAVHEPPIVSILLASYCMNCATFVSQMERLTSGHRALLLKITDTSNPEEGRAKTVVNVCKPLLALPLGSGMTCGAPVKHPFKHEKGFTPGHAVQLIERVSVSTVDGRTLSILSTGYTKISVEHLYEGDELVLPQSMYVKDGYLKINHESVGLVAMSKGEFRLEHTSLSAKNLAYLLQQFQLKTAASCDDNRVVHVVCADGFDVDPSMLTVTLNIAAPQSIYAQLARQTGETDGRPKRPSFTPTPVSPRVSRQTRRNFKDPEVVVEAMRRSKHE